MIEPAQELIVLGDEQHSRGDSACSECWEGYPQRCDNCGGFVHAEFGDENIDGYWLYTLCDECEADKREEY